jgi:DNA primase catalytic core
MQIKEAIDHLKENIVEVVSHYVELKSHGRTHEGCCPFHNEKTPSFKVSEAKGIFKCFGCGKSGDSIAFIMEHDKVDFMDALKIGARKINLQVDWNEERKDFNEAEYKHKEALRILCGKVANFYQQCLRESNEAGDYIRNRNFEITDIADNDLLMIGYAPGGNVLLKWAKTNNINQALLQEAGLIDINKEHQLYDFFRDRIMFPICEKTGKVIGFTGRSLADKKGAAKYMNSLDTEIFHKGNELYALNVARAPIRTENRVYMVEGNFDVKRLHTIGVLNVVAPCGTALTIEQIRLLKNYTNNITIIYDGDTAGRKAIDRNGELLVKEQCNVVVMEIPDKEDPDSLFTSLKMFDEFKEKNQADYIVYKTRNGIEKCKNPAFKSEFIKEVASLIVRYDDPSKQEVYMDFVSAYIKPKKAWQDQVRSMVAEKAPVEKKVFIPPNVSADDFLETGFFEDKNCYHFADTKGIPHQRSNFVLVPLFHIESLNAKRIYEVKNISGITRVIEIPQKDMVSLSAFQIHIESLGNFWFDGSQADLNRLKRWLYAKTESCKELVQLGWQKEGFWVWGNGIFNSDFVPVDSYGIVKHGKRSYYIPAFSSIYNNEENLYQFERKFIHMESNVTLKEYAAKFVRVFGENARIALCFYFAAVFRDIVVKRFGIFPILNMFGPKGAGKTACAESLVQFFGRLAKAPNVHNTSKAALGEHVATSCNAIAHIDEYRNDIEMEKREFLKGMWDGVGRTRMNMDKDKKKETTSVDKAIVLTGQQMATADIALFSRMIFLSFTQVEYSDQERLDFVSLKEIEKRGLTHITHQLLRLRPIFGDNYMEQVKVLNEKIRELLRGEVVEDRIFNNWLIPVAAYATLNEHLELPWDIHETTKMAVRLMVAQNKETKKNDDLGNFWKVVQYLISSNVLFEEGDYKVMYEDKVTRRFFENGLWGKEIKHLEGGACDLLYMTTSRVFSLYKTQCLREGDKPLPESTIAYYLKNSTAFICETKKESFRKIDPKTGQQENDDAGAKKRTSTTAMVFYIAKTGLQIGAKDDAEGVIKSTTEGVINFPGEPGTLNLGF